MTAGITPPQTGLYAQTVADQRKAADPARSVWASANAGAGKTKVLIDRIARLLLAGAQPQKILAVTYTKAAAAEMATRLFERLGRWTVASDEDLTANLQDLDPDLTVDTQLLAKARRLFASALEAPGGLQIQTIHGFCTAILQRFPLEAGLAPGFTVLDEAETLARKQAARQAARVREQAAFLVIESHHDAEALEKILDPATSQLREHKVPARDWQAAVTAAMDGFGLAEDFDPARAWQALLHAHRATIDQAFASLEVARPKLTEKEKLTLATLKSALALPLDQEPWRVTAELCLKSDGKKRANAIFNQKTCDLPSIDRLVGIFKPEDGWPETGAAGGVLGAVVDLFQATRKQNAAFYSANLAIAAQTVSACYTAEKARTGALDFDDLLAKTAALLTSSTGAAQWVLYKLDGGIEHVLIDEAQDTSPEQWALLKPLFDALITGESDRPRTRFVVGDDKQSIYSFQGARPELFAVERDAFTRTQQPFVPHEALEFPMSFRTCDTVLKAVDAVWLQTPQGQASVPLETKYLAPVAEAQPRPWVHHIANRSMFPGMVEVWDVEPAFTADDGAGEEGDGPQGQPLDVEKDNHPRIGLAVRLADELARRIGRDRITSKDEQVRALAASDVMILLRKRGPLFHQIIKQLKARSIPVAGVDRIALPKELAVLDLVALARFALVPGDDFNLGCVLKGPFCGLVDDQADIFPLAWNRGAASLWSRLEAAAADDARYATAFRLLRELPALAGSLGPYGFFATVLEQDWDGQTGWQMLIERLGPEVREPVEIFLNRALDHGGNAAPGLLNFLQVIENDTGSVRRELSSAGAAGVRVMTVHGAKGLEAPLVILPDTTAPGQARGGKMAVRPGPDGPVLLAVPKSESIVAPLDTLKDEAAARDLEESARLLYVGMTRARDHLILCGHAPGNVRGANEPVTLAGGRTGLLKPYKVADNSWRQWIEQGLAPLADALGEPASCSLVAVDGRPEVAARVWGSQPMGVVSAPSVPPLPAVLPAWVHQTVPDESWGGPAPVRSLSPSRLLDDPDTPPVLAPTGPEALARFQRGRLIHELLQQLPDVAPGVRSDWAARRLAREPGLTADVTGGIIAQVLAVLDDPAFATVFGPCSRAEVRVAGTGPGLPPGIIINGAIDRLVVTGDSVLVVDFKTNRPPPKAVDGVARAYLVQMAAYRAVLQAAWPGKRVRAGLVWTDTPALMELPDALLDQVLKTL